MACCNNSNTRNTSARSTSCGCNNNTRSGSNSNTRSGSCNNCDFGGLGIFGRRFPLGGLARFGCSAGGGIGFPGFFSSGFGSGRSCGPCCNNNDQS